MKFRKKNPQHKIKTAALIMAMMLPGLRGPALGKTMPDHKHKSHQPITKPVLQQHITTPVFAFDSKILRGDEDEKLTVLKQFLQGSPTAEIILQKAENLNILIEFKPYAPVNMELYGYFLESPDRCVIFDHLLFRKDNSDLYSMKIAPEDKALTLVHELTHAIHKKSGISNQDFSMSIIDRLRYVKEAEAVSFSTEIQVAYEISLLTGNCDLWNSLLRNPGLAKAALAFAEIALAEEGAVFDGRAQRAAFETVFAHGYASDDLSKLHPIANEISQHYDIQEIHNYIKKYVFGSCTPDQKALNPNRLKILGEHFFSGNNFIADADMSGFDTIATKDVRVFIERFQKKRADDLAALEQSKALNKNTRTGKSNRPRP